MAILSILLTVIIITVSILGVLIVLAQRPKQEGLGAAFGGSTLDSALGAHTTDILQKITTWLLVIFFFSAIGLAMIKTRQYDQSAASNVLESVEEREMDLPDFAPALQSPDLDSPVTPAPAEDSSTSLLDDVLAPAPAENAPAPAEDAPGAGEAPAGGEKEKAKAEKAAPKEKSEAPKEKAKAPAEGGEAGE